MHKSFVVITLWLLVSGCGIDRHSLSYTGLCADLDSSWTPQWNNLVGYWKMNDNWNDSIGSNNGSPVGGPTFLSTTVTTDGLSICPGSGGFFNGATSYTSFPQSGLSPSTSPVTAAMWVKVNAVQNQIFIQQMDGTGVGRSWLALNNSSGAFRFFTFIGNAFTIGSTIPVAGRWYHVAMTFPGGTGTINLYVNGVVESSATRTGEASDGNYVFGVQKSLATGFVYGTIAEIAIWNKELTASEIQSLYSRQVSAPPFSN